MRRFHCLHYFAGGAKGGLGEALQEETTKRGVAMLETTSDAVRDGQGLPGKDLRQRTGPRRPAGSHSGEPNAADGRACVTLHRLPARCRFLQGFGRRGMWVDRMETHGSGAPQPVAQDVQCPCLCVSSARPGCGRRAHSGTWVSSGLQAKRREEAENVSSDNTTEDHAKNMTTMTMEERRVWTAWMEEEEEKEKQDELRRMPRMGSRGLTTTEDHAKTQDATMTEHDEELLWFMNDLDAWVLALSE